MSLSLALVLCASLQAASARTLLESAPASNTSGFLTTAETHFSTPATQYLPLLVLLAIPLIAFLQFGYDGWHARRARRASESSDTVSLKPSPSRVNVLQSEAHGNAATEAAQQGVGPRPSAHLAYDQGARPAAAAAG
jgi:hypothetical protein